ncbi:hypothetical protein [Bifidobacterium callitrichidarum]|uniref:Uncharacterized protein n=1 Tax=Bifidobacterium callitrichidarum TaxID=2052941 RepID=A0A2U2N3E9_9BIFI|nr:hypothetical protein [Bifidobacterium callitrichidarum]PWG63613.1 hypothetical protein DF196_10635 [Bifidobacterium callitrichidarum]
MYEEIDALQERDQYYVIDYIPYDTDDPRFLELEEYFERTYLPSFAEKIIRIILKTIYRFPCAIYVTGPSEDDDSMRLSEAGDTPSRIERTPNNAEPASEATIPISIPYDTDISGYPPAELAAIIRRIVLTDGPSSVQVLCSIPHRERPSRFLISICGGFSVTVYGAEPRTEATDRLQALATQEGLFLKHRSDA